MSLLTLSTHFGYLDGGTGSLVLQAVLAAVVTGGYVIKSRWQTLKQALVRKDAQPPSSSK